MIYNDPLKGWMYHTNKDHDCKTDEETYFMCNNCNYLLRMLCIMYAKIKLSHSAAK